MFNMDILIDCVGVWLILSVFPGCFIFLVVSQGKEKDMAQSSLVYLAWVLIPPGVALFVSSTLRLYTTSVFKSRNAFRKTVLVLSTAAMYAGCLLHSVWIGFRWFKGNIRDPTTFWTLVLFDAAVFSIVTKRADMIHQRTRQPMLTTNYFWLLFVLTLIFTFFRLGWDPVAWKLVSDVASKFWLFLAPWASPFLFEYLFIPEYSQQPYPLFGSFFPSIKSDAEPARTNPNHQQVPT